MHPLKKNSLAVFLTAGLAASFSSTANADIDFNANLIIKNPISARPTHLKIPIDCSLLEENGSKTIEFIKQFGVWGHIENEHSIDAAQQHLRLHGIQQQDIEKIQKYCIENF